MDRDFTMLEQVLVGRRGQIAARLKEQNSLTEAAECTRQEIGRLIEAHYVPLLLCVLALTDEQFEAEYPDGPHVSAEQRTALAEEIRKHSGECPRCKIKFSGDMEWDEDCEQVALEAKHTRMYGLFAKV